jgi:L-ascorbate metabolism protein UlaG (beta-lactamase superfamily)
MRHVLLILAIVLASAIPAPAAEVKISWHGQSVFVIITSKGTRIVIDPHNLDAYRVPPMKADLVLMTHFHVDHTNTEVIENIKMAKQINALVKEDREGKRIDWNLVKEKFKDVQLQTLGTYHDSMSGLKYGKNGVWILDVDGLRIVHLGDLGHQLSPLQLKKLGKVDILMIPVGGVYTLNGLDAYKVFKQIKPRRYVIPMHCGTEVYDDLLPPTYFLNEAKDDEVPIHRVKLKQWLVVDGKSPLPKQASVAVLHWGGAFEAKPKPKPKGAP